MGGTNNVALTVTLTGKTAQPVSLKYATANGSAQAGSDYLTKSGSLSFGVSNAATQTKTILVPVRGDILVEGNETFGVNLSNAVNATFTNTKATVTINNDDILVKNNMVTSSSFASLDVASLGSGKTPVIDPEPSIQRIFGDLAQAHTI